jgi:hypothetical protein
MLSTTYIMAKCYNSTVNYDFVLFLLHLYLQVRGDDVVLAYAREDAMKAAKLNRRRI